MLYEIYTCETFIFDTLKSSYEKQLVYEKILFFGGPEEMAITAKLNPERSYVKIENSCTGTFLLLNREEAVKLMDDLAVVTEKM